CSKITEVRGKGLLNAVEFEEGFQARDMCVALMECGVLVKQTHGNIICFTPPLVIQRAEMLEVLERIKSVLAELD
ncbi:unnamed protein product, partial [marine sediment metagenome]